MAFNILRKPEVIRRSGYPTSTLYERMSRGLYPRPAAKLGARAVGWSEDHVERTNAALLAGASEDQIRALVAEMNAGRDRSQAIQDYDPRDDGVKSYYAAIEAKRLRGDHLKAAAVKEESQAQGGADATP
jgi:prophage regulatory protein